MSISQNIKWNNSLPPFVVIEDETSVHHFLCCPRYNVLRVTYLGKISEIIGNDVTVLPRNICILIYGSIRSTISLTNSLLVRLFNSLCNLVDLKNWEHISRLKRCIYPPSSAHLSWTLRCLISHLVIVTLQIDSH